MRFRGSPCSKNVGRVRWECPRLFKSPINGLEASNTLVPEEAKGFIMPKHFERGRYEAISGQRRNRRQQVRNPLRPAWQREHRRFLSHPVPVSSVRLEQFVQFN